MLLYHICIFFLEKTTPCLFIEFSENTPTSTGGGSMSPGVIMELNIIERMFVSVRIYKKKNRFRNSYVLTNGLS